jgi:hypothetical protein
MEKAAISPHDDDECVEGGIHGDFLAYYNYAHANVSESKMVARIKYSPVEKEGEVLGAKE